MLLQTLAPMFDGVAVPADFVRTSSGLKLRVQIGPGYGGGALMRAPGHQASLAAPLTPPFTLLPAVPAGHTLRVVAPDSTALTATVAYSPPSILRTAPLSTEGGEVVLMGENLGTAENAAAGLLAVTFDGIPATSVSTTQDHKKVKCIAPPGLGTARIRLSLGGQASSDYEALYAPPTVHSLDPPDMDPAGGYMLISGMNFGAVEDKILVLLPEVQGQMVSVQLVEAHRTLRVLVPCIPSGWEQGMPLRMRVVVGGVFASEQVDLVYSPMGGVAARDGHPAYITRRRLVVDASSQGTTPLTNIFTSNLAAETRGGKGGVGASPGRAAAGGGGGGSGSSSSSSSPVVRGALAGEGPSLSITPQSKWHPDTEACELCSRDFGMSRRRHHCRVCGSCVCASCSPFELRFTASKPPQRICSRCNLRVGLLTQMTKCLDTIESIKKLCGVDGDLYSFFKEEVTTCVSTPLARSSPAPPQQERAGTRPAGSPLAASSAQRLAVHRAAVTPISGNSEGSSTDDQ